MEKEKLWKYVSNEIEWISHYGYSEDRKNVNLDDGFIYNQIRSIGYSKVNTDLDLRCNGWLSFKISDNMLLEAIEPLNERINYSLNMVGPTDLWLLLYPEDKETIYKKINKIKI